MNFNKKIFGFTLAEILITLGIIGVVAAMTIPTLMNNYAKNATVTKLQKAYTVLFQAVKRSENDNGLPSQWTLGTNNNGTATLNWFNTYLAPYMKYTKSEIATNAAANDCIQVYLNDGTIIKFFNNGDNQVHAFIYLNGLNHIILGKDMFIYFIGGSSTVSNNKEIRPYDYPLTTVTSRTDWMTNTTYGCNKTGGAQCSGLIMYDNWQIKSDYPYFN